MIKREKFVPSFSHRVCSVHFVGGGKEDVHKQCPNVKYAHANKAKKTVRRVQGKEQEFYLPIG